MERIPKEKVLLYDKAFVWHPFTQMKEWVEGNPLIIERAKGNYLYDIDGNKYFDGVSSIWCNVHGHRKKEIDDAIRKQLTRIAHSTYLGLAHPEGALLAKRLAAITPEGLTKTFYSDSGSEAVEIALKMAYLYWQHKGETTRTKFIAFKESYHGDTIGSVSVGGIETFHRTFRPLLFDVYFAATPYCRECQYGKNESPCTHDRLDEVERELRERGDEYAGVIIEPLVQGATGMLVYPKGTLARLREITKKYNTLLIADEVATGFGRTGRMFACEHEEVVPDIMCLAKGITGGYLPLAATMATDEVYQAYYDEYSTLKTFFHGHTYTANQLACAAALANLDVFVKETLILQLPGKSAHIRDRASELMGLPHVGDVRLVGLMGGVEVVADKAKGTAYDFTMKMGYKVCDACIARGLWMRPLGNTVIIMPPLSITHDEIDFYFDTLYAAIREATEGGA